MKKMSSKAVNSNQEVLKDIQLSEFTGKPIRIEACSNGVPTSKNKFILEPKSGDKYFLECKLNGLYYCEPLASGDTLTPLVSLAKKFRTIPEELPQVVRYQGETITVLKENWAMYEGLQLP